jgi:CheY-like chemotaxis protein
MTTDTKKTLLILEEGETVTRALKPTFEKAGYEVITYRDATGVLIMARQIQADVMVLDAALRGAGALSALKSFARNVHTAGVPVIALVGKTGPKAEALLAAGARACTSDPPDPKEVLSLAEKHQLDTLDFSQAPAEALEEPARVEALEETAILDSPPDSGYDRVTRLASKLMGVPVSLATFVGTDRQFFKAETGLEGKWKERRGTPLSHSFCQWVVSSRQPVVIDDSKRHRVLRSNAAVDDLGVVAYAGVPIMGKGGQPLGSMCAIDHVTRSWSPADVETLQDLAIVLQSYALHDSERVKESLQAATRLICRHGSRLTPDARADLVGIIDEQATRLAA